LLKSNILAIPGNQGCDRAHQLAELQRLKAVYPRRDQRAASAGSHLIGLGDLFMLQQRQKAVVDALRRVGFERFDDIRLLDVGCGGSGPLSQFLIFGALPEALFGLDILMSALQRTNNRYLLH
jgi:2-polyprenyl-3-methyl-5-hydroxy-6-metoxy-1,4-benzoquinol methylase